MGDERFVTHGDGYTTWHCFSSGAHYDAERMSWGPVIAIDEHLVAPGAGFDWHPHRGVHIVSWVVEGTLRHEDSSGGARSVEPGTLFVQSTGGDGIRHRETNGSGVEQLRMIQLVLLGATTTSIGAVPPPVAFEDAVVDVVRGPVQVLDGLVFQTRGERAGSLSLDGDQVDAEALVIRRVLLSKA